MAPNGAFCEKRNRGRLLDVGASFCFLYLLAPYRLPLALWKETAVWRNGTGTYSTALSLFRGGTRVRRTSAPLPYGTEGRGALPE